MFCTNCGQPAADNAAFCPTCGRPLSPVAEASMPAAQSPMSTPPIGLPDPRLAAAAQPQPYQPLPDAQNSGKATVSLVFGILSFIFWIPASVVALITGVLARKDIRQSAGRLKGDGMALTGIILGGVTIVLVPIALIFAAIMIPNLIHARVVANEATTMSNLRTVANAQLEYFKSHGKFACKLTALGPDGDNLVPRSIASGSASGFTYQLSCGDAEASYDVFASPDSPAQGSRAYCTDQSGIIRRYPARQPVKPPCAEFASHL